MHALISFAIAFAAEAQINPTIPGAATSTNPVELIAGLYRFALMISGLLALAVIIYGAIKYASNPGNSGNLADAKEWIVAALTGILLLVGAYIILNTINPELTKLTLPTLKSINSIPPPGQRPVIPGAKTGEYGYQGVATPFGTLTDQQAWALFQAAGVGRNKDNCLTEGAIGCTSFDGLPKKAVDGVIAIKRACNCEVVVTAGTEKGHQTHRIGRAIVDLRSLPGLNSYVYAIIGTTNPPACGTPIRGNDLVSYRWETTACADGDHWHVNFE